MCLQPPLTPHASRETLQVGPPTPIVRRLRDEARQDLEELVRRLGTSPEDRRRAPQRLEARRSALRRDRLSSGLKCAVLQAHAWTQPLDGILRRGVAGLQLEHVLDGPQGERRVREPLLRDRLQLARSEQSLLACRCGSSQDANQRLGERERIPHRRCVISQRLERRRCLRVRVDRLDPCVQRALPAVEPVREQTRLRQQLRGSLRAGQAARTQLLPYPDRIVEPRLVEHPVDERGLLAFDHRLEHAVDDGEQRSRRVPALESPAQALDMDLSSHRRLRERRTLAQDLIGRRCPPRAVQQRRERCGCPLIGG